MNLNKFITHPDVFADVSEFFMLAQPELEGKPFGKYKDEIPVLGNRLIVEEGIKELSKRLEAIKSGGYSFETMAQFMDDCCDTIFVILWTMKGFDLPFNEHWNETVKKNMDKFPLHKECGGGGCTHAVVKTVIYEGKEVTATEGCKDGRLVLRNFETGKVMKPEGWTPPDQWNILYKYWADKEQKEQDKDEKDPHTQLKGFQQLDYQEEKNYKRPNDALHGTKDE